MPRYDALGYGCGTSPGSGRRDPMLIGPRGGAHSNVFCRTIYYVDLATGKLAAFFTGSAAFRTTRGTRLGMTQADAARRERSTPTGGCSTQILERGKVATLAIPLVNGKVAALELESAKNALGLLFC